MSVRDLVRLLRRNLMVVVVCLIAGATLGSFAALSRPASYTSHAQLFVSSNGSDSTDTLLQNSNLVMARVPSYASLVNSPLILSQVADRLSRTESVPSLAARVSATNPLQTALIDITVQDTTAQGAYDLAAAVSAVVMAELPRLETAATGFVPIKIALVSQPELPARAELGPAGYRLAVGVLLGLLIGAAIAVGRELLYGRLADPEQLRAKLDLAPLGVLAGLRKTDRRRPPDDAYWASRAGEGYRQLRANLRVLVATDGLRSVLVTGPRADDGAAVVARNLALALSRVQKGVLLIEADLRHPVTRQDRGLAAVLSGDLDAVAAIQPWPDSKLHVLPAGPGSAASGELLASDAMRELLGRLEHRFDLVIISAPPLLEVADTAVLAAEVDGVLLTARSGGTRWTALRQSVQALYDARARVLGAAVLGRSRGAGRASTEALAAPVEAAVEAPPPPRRPIPVPVPPRPPTAIDRQLAPARGVAAVNQSGETTANFPAEDPHDNRRWP
ncbi:polysaccharide biosynthesis tyrosine autokinase [Actinoplanes solisilvae]|uniref:polysaccharide biosynthesis tyrosine autokinase n=1 Tax=Actinoplanes solisilvae TaxID=2486853 RepID=UPI0013E32E3F|nr:polysaccharide biosynthesis tyrosine autokinase [Actinoplanes solisilvae]